MINKKILALAVAAAFSTSSYAVVDLDADTGSLVIASESIDTGDLDGDGNVVLTDAGTALEVQNKVGFSIAANTSKYVRYDITNGEFASITNIDDGTNAAVTVVSSGGVGESYAVFELAADVSTITAAAVLNLDATYAMTDGAALSIKYKLFETAQDAVDNVTDGLSTTNGVIATIQSALTGTFSDASTITATVADEFKKFGGSDSDTLNDIDVADLDDTTESYLFPDTATAFDNTDLATGSATVTFSGDFSFGTFSYNGATWSYDEDGVFVGTGSAVENEDGTVEVDYGASSLVVDTVDTDTVRDVATKGSYTAKLDGVTVTGVTPVHSISASTEASGTIIYDTTSINIPYLTTYTGLNQKIYIVNSSSQDATYTTTFVSEDGITATGGSMATGVIPGGEMVTIKATDLVTLTGGTRSSATIEIEAQDTSVLATSQTVNKATGTTDTVVLFNEVNANTN